jgi:xanthine/uracil/vitamin C permease (AzgA family)
LRSHQHTDYRNQIRKLIIKAIPHSIQNAISEGIGIFIAYIGYWMYP